MIKSWILYPAKVVKMRHLSFCDRILIEADALLKTISTSGAARRRNPGADITEAPLSSEERRQSASLMRVNDSGEVCAQALYRGHALGAQDRSLKAHLYEAAEEEQDHLAWCRERLKELDARPSVLNIFWYLGSLGLGIGAAKFGDSWGLGFVEETEIQVMRHLDGHLEKLSPQDHKTRAILSQMRQDEAKHAAEAKAKGAEHLPRCIKVLMSYHSKVMTTLSYYI